MSPRLRVHQARARRLAAPAAHACSRRPARPGRGGRGPGPSSRREGPSLLTRLAARSPTRPGHPRGPPQPTERRAPAGRARAAPPGLCEGGRPVGRDPASGQRGTPAPVPRSRPMPSGLTQTTERTLGPSLRTQSRRRRPSAKFPHNDASTTAILPRGGRRLLTLAPARRARAPRREFCARTEVLVPRFRAAAAPRPRAGHLIGCRLAISRSRGKRLRGRPPVCLPSRSPPPPPPLPRPPLRLPLPGAAVPAPPGLPPAPAPERPETAQRGRRDPHGKMAAAGPGRGAERPRGSAAGRGRAWRGVRGRGWGEGP